MTGLIIETLSTKKLIAITVLAGLSLFACFLLGGLIAPSPYNVQALLSTICIDEVGASSSSKNVKWQVPWPKPGCDQVSSLQDERINEEGINSSRIVFAVRFPLRKDNITLDMSRWHQNIIAVFHFDVDHDSKMEIPISEVSEITVDARLAYMDKGQKDWKPLAQSEETRQLHCRLALSGDSFHGDETPIDQQMKVYHCDMLPLFELGSCHYDYYLVNLRLPVIENSTMNANVPPIKDVWIYAIHPNGGFTKVWVAMKTVAFPLILAALAFNIHRIRQSGRPFNLLDKCLIALGLAISLLNIPIEYFTLWVYMPYMMLFSDIRQGIFYSILLGFWIIFAGEHLMDQVERNRLVVYWRHLSGVAFACISLFVFEMCERGVQLYNPFYSIWSTPTGAKMAIGFIVLAAIAACVYFFFLLYMIVMVFRNITAKKSSLPQMSKARRNFYMGLIYRFNFLMAITLVCAAATVVFFVLGQTAEGSWKWDSEQKIEYPSAFLTGVYGMWNIYVLCLLLLYSPSSKNMSGSTTEASEDEVIEFANMPSEAHHLTALAQKADLD